MEKIIRSNNLIQAQANLRITNSWIIIKIKVIIKINLDNSIAYASLASYNNYALWTGIAFFNFPECIKNLNSQRSAVAADLTNKRE